MNSNELLALVKVSAALVVLMHGVCMNVLHLNKCF